MMRHHSDDSSGSDPKSRSRKKRESTALQQRGEELAALSPAVWKTLPLTPELSQALTEAKTLKSHEARRRQMQYIGRLMREQDEESLDDLLNALDALQSDARQEAAAQHRLETLRESLLADSAPSRAAALASTLSAHPRLDAARLRHLVDAALAEREKKRPPKFARELFRYLRDGVEEVDGVGEE